MRFEPAVELADILPACSTTADAEDRVSASMPRSTNSPSPALAKPKHCGHAMAAVAG
jgi:hypothetical protein